MVPFGMASVQLATALLSNPQGPQGIFADESGAFYDFIEIDKAVLRFQNDVEFLDKYGMYDTITCSFSDGTPCTVFKNSWDKDDESRCQCKIAERQRVEVYSNASLLRGASCAFNNTVCFIKTNESELEDQAPKIRPKRNLDKREDFFDLKMLAPDCSQIRGPVQLFKMLMNSTGRRFDCVNMARLKVDSHTALDDEIYNGFGDSPGHTSKVQGVVHGFDFKDTVGGNALHLTLMHNISGVTDDLFGVSVKWRPWQTRILTTLNQVLRGFLAETHSKPALESQLLLGLKSYPQVRTASSGETSEASLHGPCTLLMCSLTHSCTP